MASTAAPTTLPASIRLGSRSLASAASSRSDRLRSAAVPPIALLPAWRRRVSISRAAAHEAGRNRQINTRVLSAFDLEKQIEADGATWLDRRLVGRGPADLVAAGFGQEVQQAMDRRREHLIEQGDAIRHADGRIFYRRNLLATLEQRDVICAGTALAASRSLWRLQADRPALERQVRAGRERPRIHAGALAAGDREPARPRSDGRRPGWIGVVAARAQIGAGALTRKMRQTMS